MIPVLTLENLNYIYSSGTPFKMDAIKDISISINTGETVGIIGHTGSGKSTLVQHLNGLLRPTSGRVLLNGHDIWSEPKKIREVRFKVGLVFQYPEHQLFDETVRGDIAFGAKNMGLDETETSARVKESAELVGLDTALLDKSPFDLSGGERRRAAIAGVLAMRPEVLVLDEPTAGLDPKGKDLILERIMEYKHRFNATVIIVSHSMEDIARLSDRVLVLNRGAVFAFDTVTNIYSDGERLAAIGLSLPGITTILWRLKTMGADINTDIFTVEAAKAELLRALRGGGAHA